MSDLQSQQDDQQELQQHNGQVVLPPQVQVFMRTLKLPSCALRVSPTGSHMHH